MDARTFPLHPDNWTLEEVLAWPDDQGNRIELIDGLVVVSPYPGTKHQRLLGRIGVAWHDAVQPEFELLSGVNVVLNSTRLLIPDLVVVTTPGTEGRYVRGNELLVAVEIHSPSTRAYDRALKRRLYADAGIPFLVFVDPATDPASAVCFELNGDEYRESARADAGRLVLTRPFAATVDFAVSGR